MRRHVMFLDNLTRQIKQRRQGLIYVLLIGPLWRRFCHRSMFRKISWDHGSSTYIRFVLVHCMGVVTMPETFLYHALPFYNLPTYLLTPLWGAVRPLLTRHVEVNLPSQFEHVQWLIVE